VKTEFVSLQYEFCYMVKLALNQLYLKNWAHVITLITKEPISQSNSTKPGFAKKNHEKARSDNWPEYNVISIVSDLFCAVFCSVSEIAEQSIFLLSSSIGTWIKGNGDSNHSQNWHNRFHAGNQHCISTTINCLETPARSYLQSGK